MDFTVVYTKEAEGGYTAEILELPGCVSYGETMEEAQIMIKEATEAYIESLHKEAKKIFLPRKTFIGSLHVNETVFA